MNRLFAVIALLCFVFTQIVVAQEQERNIKESWYTYWGLGYASVTYPTALQAVMETVEQQPGVTRTRVGLDMLGFYWPVNDHRTALGFIINGAGDRLDVSGNWVQINNYLYAASVMHFMDRTIGDGFFFRGDVGFAKALTQDSQGSSIGSKTGFGFLLGGGYSIPVTSGTRILINVNYSNRRIEGDNLQTVGVTLGGLF
jgi:opacity protein-like surface antigen